MDDLSSFFKSSRDEICFSINNIIDEVYSLMKARMVNSGISFNLTHTTDEYTQEATDGNVPDTLKSMKDIFIKGVPAEFKQVLINILNNSIDAILERLNNDPIHNDGNISFDIETRQSSLHIYIKDNGIGLTPETMKKVFEPYFTTKEGGTGIGLYMSKIIIEEHMKGRLSSSSLPQGAIFTINLPLDSLC
jgi:signal transduction histidine kinase